MLRVFWSRAPGRAICLKRLCEVVLHIKHIHAFFSESGLWGNSGLGKNELLVDWLAIQLPKMVKVMERAGCMEPAKECKEKDYLGTGCVYHA